MISKLTTGVLPASVLVLLLGLAACDVPGESPLIPESDAHAVLQLERDLWLRGADGVPVQATDLLGAEDMEAVSPDGRRVAFVAGPAGLAGVWVARIPLAQEAPAVPVQLTNVGLRAAARPKGQPPRGFVPVPDDGALVWDGDEALTWRSGGRSWRVEVPR